MSNSNVDANGNWIGTQPVVSDEAFVDPKPSDEEAPAVPSDGAKKDEARRGHQKADDSKAAEAK